MKNAQNKNTKNHDFEVRGIFKMFKDDEGHRCHGLSLHAEWQCISVRNLGSSILKNGIIDGQEKSAVNDQEWNAGLLEANAHPN